VAFQYLLGDDESACMGKFPITADNPSSGFGATHGNGRQCHIDTVFFEDARLGT